MKFYQHHKHAYLLPGLVVFIITLVIGWCTYQDRGMSWDEPAQHLIGIMNYNYVFNHDSALLTFHDKEYGAGFELPLIMLEKAMGLTDTRDVYLMRHLVSHLFFLVSMFCGYVLVYRLFKSRLLAVLGYIMLVFAPRIYAHSFFNTKDIPFLCMALVTLAVAQMAFDRRKPFLFLLLGLTLGYAAGIRTMAVLPGCLILLFLCTDAVIAFARKEKPLTSLMRIVWVVIGFCMSLYVSCPFYWENPVKNFTDCVSKMAGKGFCGYDLINGKFESSANLPWFYLPEWMGVTTPELWVLFGVTGIVLLVDAMFRKPLQFLQNTHQRNFLLYLLCFAAPSAAVILRHSVMYDEWRHLFFIYPAFVLIALYGVHELMKTKARKLVVGMCLVQCLVVGYFMVTIHPFQNLYFNSFVKHDKEYLRSNFEFDYWGGSMKQALDHILETDKRETIKISTLDFGPCLDNNIMMLPKDVRKRIVVTQPEASEYMVTTFRNHPKDFDYPIVAHEVIVLNSTVVRVYRGR